jgi:hypothetical protein
MTSKAALIDELDRLLPGFAAYQHSPDNLFDGDSLHAVFSAASHFVIEEPVAPAAWAPLAQFLNAAVSGDEPALSDAACTCFLENVAAPDHPLEPHLTGKAREYWKNWETAD